MTWIPPHAVPCADHPDDFLQPGEREGWHRTESARRALFSCKECPYRQPCATAALTAGTTLDATIAALANGVIQAGVVCRGDVATLRALRAVAGGEPDACTACGRSFAHVVPKARGLCSGCYSASRRVAGIATAQPRPTPAPECSDCDRPMSRPPVPAGHVRHSAHGRCHTCDARWRRATGRAA